MDYYQVWEKSLIKSFPSLGIYLLNSLVCHVDRGQKTLVGDLGAMEKLVKLIRNKLAKNQCDEVMEIAWSTIWNVTGKLHCASQAKKN